MPNFVAEQINQNKKNLHVTEINIAQAPDQ